jgi:hypothetical protein
MQLLPCMSTIPVSTEMVALHECQKKMTTSDCAGHAFFLADRSCNSAFQDVELLRRPLLPILHQLEALDESAVGPERELSSLQLLVRRTKDQLTLV